MTFLTIFCLNIYGSGMTADTKPRRGVSQFKDNPVGTSVNSVKCNKPVNSTSHYGQWGYFFLACGQTNSVENP